jgi:hypothetical protein
MGLQASFSKNIPNAFLGCSCEGVDILADGAFEEERGLRDDRNVLTERMKPHV